MIEQITVDIKGSANSRIFNNSKELVMECDNNFLVIYDGNWKTMIPLDTIQEVRVLETKDNKQAET